jgi:long-chain fatty acid transport protein
MAGSIVRRIVTRGQEGGRSAMKHLRGRIAAALALLSLNALIPAAARAGGLMLYEVGSADVGLASAGYSARAQDASTVLTNPAGMTRLPGSQLLIGTQLLYAPTAMTLDLAQTSPGLGTGDGGAFVGLLPGGGLFYTHTMSPKVTLGIASTSNFGLAESYDDDWAGRYYIQSSTLIGISILPSIAYRANDKLSLGASLNAMYGIFKTKVAVNNPTSTSDGQLSLDDKHWGFGGNFGLLYEPDARTRIGITYNSQVNLDFTAPAEFTGLEAPLQTLLGAAGLLNADIDLGMKVPQGVMASFYKQPKSNLALLGSVGWQQWSKFGEVEVGVDSNNPTTLTTDLDYMDTWHGALGVQKKSGESWLLNFGVAFDSKFQSAPYLSPTLPSNWAWRFGVGGQHHVSDKFSWGLSGEYAYGGTIEVNERSQVPVAAGGRGDLVGSYENTGIWFGAANFTWKL